MNTTITTAVASVIAAVLLAGALSAQTKAPKQPDPAIYAKLRDQLLSGSRKELGLPPGASPSEPWGVLMDINGGKGYTYTTVAIADGTASIYLSNGGGFIGGGQRYEAIRHAAITFVAIAASYRAQMKLATTFPLPKEGETAFYLLTDAGVFSTIAQTDLLGVRQHQLAPLFAAGQDVITQYRLTQQEK